MLCLLLHLSPLLLQEASSPTSDIAAQAKTAALSVSNRVQAAAQSAANALSSHHTDLQIPEEAQTDSRNPGEAQCTDAGRPADSDSNDSPASGASVNPNGPAPEKARRALMERIGMVTEGFSDDDCTCFDTTLGCTLKVR